MLSSVKGFVGSALPCEHLARVTGDESILRLGGGKGLSLGFWAQLLSQWACRSFAPGPWWTGLSFALWPVGQLKRS